VKFKVTIILEKQERNERNGEKWSPQKFISISLLPSSTSGSILPPQSLPLDMRQSRGNVMEVKKGANIAGLRLLAFAWHLGT
jgi:hypothetical protein